MGNACQLMRKRERNIEKDKMNCAYVLELIAYGMDRHTFKFFVGEKKREKKNNFFPLGYPSNSKDIYQLNLKILFN